MQQDDLPLSSVFPPPLPHIRRQLDPQRPPTNDQHPPSVSQTIDPAPHRLQHLDARLFRPIRMTEVDGAREGPPEGVDEVGVGDLEEGGGLGGGREGDGCVGGGEGEEGRVEVDVWGGEGDGDDWGDDKGEGPGLKVSSGERASRSDLGRK